MLKFIKFGEYLYLPTYNLLIGLGLILGLLFFEKDIAKRNIDFKRANHIKTAIIIVFVIGFFGAFIFDALVKNIPFKYDLLKNNVGFTFYGGFILGLIALFISFRFLKVNTQNGLSLIVPLLLISHAFGRIGCFMAGCCYGKPTNSIFGVTFPIDSFPYEEYQCSLSIHPTQLYEAFFLIILFFICLKYISFYNRIPFYLISYGLLRFLIEFFRADNRGVLFSQTILSPSQLISLLLILVGLIITIKSIYSKQN